MRPIIALFSALLLTAVSTTVQNDGRFEPFARLAGSCWEGTFPNGVKDRHCWDWALDGAYLRDVHELRGAREPYGGETFYGWDEDAGSLRFWYFNTAGGRSGGSVERLEGEQKWLLIENYSGATPHGTEEHELEMRNFVTFEEDAYAVVTEQKEGDSWKEVMAIRFVRQ